MKSDLLSKHFAFRIIRLAVLCVFFGTVLEFFFVAGLVQPLRIDSGSMVPALHGPRFVFVCETCRHTFLCGADGPIERTRFTCPACGFAENSVQTARFLQGERILIDRFTPTFSQRKLRRFDLIVFRDAKSPSRWNAKRIVALPGETVAFCDGNLWINGTILRKNLDMQVKVAAIYRFGRWIDESTPTERRFSFDPSEPIPHFAPLHPGSEIQQSEMTPQNNPRFYSTRNPYNQLRIERKEETQTPSDEILLTLSARFFDAEITITTKRETLVIKKSDPQTLSVLRNEKHFASVPVPEKTGSQQSESVRISVIDRTLQIGWEQSTLLVKELPDTNETQKIPANFPIQISFPIRENEALDILASLRELETQIEIRLDPFLSGPAQRWTVPQDAYFVLGDNSAISEDSRFWNPPHVERNAILGRVLGK